MVSLRIPARRRRRVRSRTGAVTVLTASALLTAVAAGTPGTTPEPAQAADRPSQAAAVDPGLLAQDDAFGVNVALNCTLNLDLTLRLQITGDRQP